ncbi:MAG: hypothetical protein WBO10_12710 [Pyrinomonadaceae bacterium]
MRYKLLFGFGIVCLAVCGVSAQRPTITNFDLEKYRQERIRAETDLRENYEKLGFPSPAELERRRVESQKATQELSAKLRAQELEQERIDAQRAEAARFAAYYQSSRVQTEVTGYPIEYYWIGGRRYQRPASRGWSQTGYFAGGQFWPTGSRTKPRPLFTVRPR